MTDDRRYKDDEVRAIIDRALKQQPDSGVTHEELLAIGAGVGALPIVATSPLVTMILSFFLDGARPGRRAVIGSLLAVIGAVALKLVQKP